MKIICLTCSTENVISDLRSAEKAPGQCVRCAAPLASPGHTATHAAAGRMSLEISGLLDLRGMARGDQGNIRVDEPVPMPVFAGDVTPLALAAVRLPMQPKGMARRDRIILAVCSAAGALAIGAMVLAAVIVRSNRGAPQAGAPAPQAGTAFAAQPRSPADGVSPAPGPDSRLAAPSSPQSPQSDVRSAAAPRVAATPAPEAKRAAPRERRRTEQRSARSKPRAQQPAPRAPKRKAEESCMDEVACLLAHEAPACCARYRDDAKRGKDRSKGVKRSSALLDD